MTDEGRLHSALNRITSAVGTIRVRRDDDLHTHRHGAVRDSGLEAMVERLEVVADQLEEALKS